MLERDFRCYKKHFAVCTLPSKAPISCNCDIALSTAIQQNVGVENTQQISSVGKNQEEESVLRGISKPTKTTSPMSRYICHMATCAAFVRMVYNPFTFVNHLCFFMMMFRNKYHLLMLQNTVISV